MNPKSNCSMIVLLKQRGVKHVVVTYAMRVPVWMKIPQMQETAHDGAYIEFVYNALTGAKPDNTIEEYAKAIRDIGPKYCILATDLGGVSAGRASHPDGMLMFTEALRKEGLSQADVDMMSKTNPALILGLQ
jgi:microsomal dipeptidase-like Zn-dependent dipeptidase